jgi:hypothetical protein
MTYRQNAIVALVALLLGAVGATLLVTHPVHGSPAPNTQHISPTPYPNGWTPR